MLASERCCLPPAASPGHRRTRGRSEAARGNVSTVLERGSVEAHCHLNGGRRDYKVRARARALTWTVGCAERGQRRGRAQRRWRFSAGARKRSTHTTKIEVAALSPSQLPADALIASVGGIPCVGVAIGCRVCCGLRRTRKASAEEGARRAARRTSPHARARRKCQCTPLEKEQRAAGRGCTYLCCRGWRQG